MTFALEHDRARIADMREDADCEPCDVCDHGQWCPAPHARPVYTVGVLELWDEDMASDVNLPAETDSDGGEPIVCPWCRTMKHTDLSEYFAHHDNDVEVECGCGGTFVLSRVVTVDYVARPVKP